MNNSGLERYYPMLGVSFTPFHQDKRATYAFHRIVASILEICQIGIIYLDHLAVFVGYDDAERSCGYVW